MKTSIEWEESMKIQNIYINHDQTKAISEQLLVLKKVYFANEDSLEKGHIVISKAQISELQDAINYLDKEKESLPDSYRKKIDEIVAAIKSRPSFQQLLEHISCDAVLSKG
jgi:predicted ribosome quality control (RQC) complex YloA/Tae2 family protein